MYKKINVAILLISIFLVFIFIIFYIEHINSKRKENALIYYNQIIPIITLADALDADLEYSDNYGNKGILKGGEENLIRRVSDDIRAYITKQNNHIGYYRSKWVRYTRYDSIYTGWQNRESSLWEWHFESFYVI